MYFAKWETIDGMIENVPLKPVNGKAKIVNSGFPIAYDEENVYITDKLNHSLVIGSSGSGKTQAIILPMLELSRRAGESVVIHDTKSELYDLTKEKFRESGYNVIKLNFDSAINCNSWNPFELPYKLYKEGNKDKAQELLENLSYYLLNDMNEQNLDPFWINSAMNYFTGISLYMFEYEKEINLNTIRKIDIMIQEDELGFKNKIDKNSNIYLNLSGILNAPSDTRGSIISVFSQKIKKIISKENLINMLSKSDFDITTIGKEKTIIYIISGNSTNSEKLLPLLISQVYFAKDEYLKKEGVINITVDDFYELCPMIDFAKMLNYSRGIGIIFTIMVRGFNDLKNQYGEEETELIKMCFNNIVYLLSQDIKTLEEISNMCGKANIDGGVKPLISVEELKTLKRFEAIVLMVRLMPFRTKLLPYYQMKG